MADVNTIEPRPIASPLYLRDEELKQGMDLVFHAFSELFAQGEEVLQKACLGRAHHRALHFIARNPDISVTDLLAILKITKQSLNRVLNDLLKNAFVERRPSVKDRRMRLTAKGTELDALLWETQRPRLSRAFRQAGPDAVLGFRKVLVELCPPERKPRGSVK
jgi:DNA-binding MarR family transcriptional regulator